MTYFLAPCGFGLGIAVCSILQCFMLPPESFSDATKESKF